MNPIKEAIEARSLYEVTGDIKDINTVLIDRAALAALRSMPTTLGKGITRDDTVHGEEYFTRSQVEAVRSVPAEPVATDPEDCTAWCPRCDGTGDGVEMSDSSPDAHEVTVNCRHCDGVGTLYAAYTGVVRELAKKHQAYIKACGELYFAKRATPHTEAVRMSEAEIDAITNAQWGEQIGAMYAAYRAYARAVEQATAARLGVKWGGV